LEKSHKLIKAMKEIGSNYDATVAQVALNWIIHAKGDLVVTIPGVTNPRQAEDNAGTMKFKLTDDELSQLNELS